MLIRKFQIKIMFVYWHTDSRLLKICMFFYIKLNEETIRGNRLMIACVPEERWSN